MRELVPIQDANPSVLFQPGGLDNLLHAIKREATAVVYDVTTESGRKGIASAAYQVKRSKTYLDDLGRDYVRELKDLPRRIDAERRAMRDFLDEVAEKIRRPLNIWEDNERFRLEQHNERLSQMRDLPKKSENENSERLAAIIQGLEDSPIDDTWQEFKGAAEEVRKASLYELGKLMEKAKTLEEARAIKAQEEERLRIEREKRIAEEASERATRLAEERARAAAVSAKLEAEWQARVEADKAERERQEAIHAQQEAERRIKEAEERAARAAEEAVKAERARVEALKAEEEKRAANKRRRDTVHNRIIEAIVRMDIMAEADANLLIKNISEGKIPHLEIKY